MQFLLKYSTLSLNKKEIKISHVLFQWHHSKPSLLRISQKMSMILSRSANTTAYCQHTFPLLSSFCHLHVLYCSCHADYTLSQNAEEWKVIGQVPQCAAHAVMKA